MKIAIIGATGFVGSALVKEALMRGHIVTAIARNPTTLETEQENLKKIEADVFDKAGMVAALHGNDVVISAYNPGWSNPDLYQDFIDGSKGVEEAVKQSGIRRLIVIGGAGSLYIAPGLQLVDTPEFPEAYKSGATAARDYLNILKEDTTLDWTFFSPAIEMHHGIDT
ncbi:MAG TPA: NAD(P)H-binding protein, partial [Chitinophagaceae bacterium]|nr:NAD(P)H-binding protein [Chitinophagaceae bacterium]